MASPRVQLTVGIRDVSVAFAEAVALEPEQSLRQVQVTVRCGACGAEHACSAEPVYDTHDDDHYGRLELWYTTTHQVGCSCGPALEVVLGHTETRNLLTGGRTLLCDGVRSRRGGDVV